MVINPTYVDSGRRRTETPTTPRHDDARRKHTAHDLPLGHFTFP
jgi:hypothetical protein